jgi:WD40 repeat protein
MQYSDGSNATGDERKSFMPQLQNYVWSLTILAVMIGQPLWGEQARSPASRTDPLPSGALSRFGTSRFLNYGRVFSIAFSPNGESLAARSWDGVVRLWEVSTGNELRQFGSQQAPVRSVAFSPDSKILACGGESSEIVFWDPGTGKELRRLAGHRGPVALIKFSPDGKLLATKGGDWTLRLWDAASGRELRRLGKEDPASEVNDGSPVVFSAGGKTAASATVVIRSFDSQRTFRVWDVATGTEIRSFKGKRTSFGPVAFSPDGKILAVGGRTREGAYIYLWDVDRGIELRPIEQGWIEGVEAVNSLAFSPDGKTLASSGIGPYIQLWEVATHREIGRFQIPDAGLAPLAFSPDGRLLASGSTDITVLLWDVTGRIDKGKLRPAQLSPQELQSLWVDLGSSDVPKARRALWTFVAASGPGVAFLREHLHPAASPASPETISRLVDDLDRAEFPVRTKAMTQLVKLGELTEPALLAALQKHPALELRQRLERVLNQLVNQRYNLSGDRLRLYRAVEILEQIGTPEARQILETLSHGATGALLTREAKAARERLSRQAVAHP